GVGHHDVLLHGIHDRDRSDASDVHHSERRKDRGLYHGTIRMTAMSTNPAAPSSSSGPLLKTTLTPRSGPRPSIEAGMPAIEARDFKFSYGAGPVLKGITFTIPRRAVTAIIGPSGCGKSTFLRSINRMHDLLPGATYGGDILLEGKSIFGSGT